MRLLSSTWYGNKNQTATSYSVYFDSTGNRKLLQSDLPFACYYSRIVKSLILQRSKSDSKALFIWIKKCLNPRKNSSSKVIAHWQYFYMGPQHKSVQYKWLALHLYRDVSHTDLMKMFPTLLPIVYIFLSLFVLRECVLMLITSITEAYF